MAPGGAVAVISVDEISVLRARLVPNDTELSGAKFDPVIVTVLPPVVGPELGDTPVTTGDAR